MLGYKKSKRKDLPENSPPILDRLGMDQKTLLNFLCCKPDKFTSVLGPVSRLRQLAQSLGLKFIKGGQPGAQAVSGIGIIFALKLALQAKDWTKNCRRVSPPTAR